MLLVDDRERVVVPHLGALKERMKVTRLLRGDYSLVRGGEVLAVIERKSLKDYGASIRDHRMENKYGLVEVKEACRVCQVYFLIEGPAFPKPDTEYGGVVWENIESSIFHLMTQFGVQIMRSRDEEDSARMLMKLLKSMAERPPQSVANAPRNVEGDTAIEGSDETAMLFVGQVMSQVDRRVQMWSALEGVGGVSASKLSVGPIVEVLRGGCPGWMNKVQRQRFEDIQGATWNDSQLAFVGAIHGVGKKKKTEWRSKFVCMKALWVGRMGLSRGDQKLLEDAFM
jgi:ERCC4-type nuclease